MGLNCFFVSEIVWVVQIRVILYLHQSAWFPSQRVGARRVRTVLTITWSPPLRYSLKDLVLGRGFQPGASVSHGKGLCQKMMAKWLCLSKAQKAMIRRKYRKTLYVSKSVEIGAYIVVSAFYFYFPFLHSPIAPSIFTWRSQTTPTPQETSPAETLLPVSL